MPGGTTFRQTLNKFANLGLKPILMAVGQFLLGGINQRGNIHLNKYDTCLNLFDCAVKFNQAR